MFYSLGYDEYLAWPERDISFTHLNRYSASEYQEEVVCVFVPVPNELAFDFDDHEVVAIELPHRSRLPMLVECRELLREVDRIHLR